MQELGAAVARRWSRVTRLLPPTIGSARERATALGLLILVVAVMVITVADLDFPFRFLLTVGAVVTAPGWAVAAYFLPLPPSMEWTLAVGFSLVGSIALSTVMLMTGWWYPVPVMVGYLFLTDVALMTRLLRPARQRGGRPALTGDDALSAGDTPPAQGARAAAT